MRVQHLRGTTREWQEANFDIIPEAGELVIEECENGIRKCKIGTGFTRFSELPYIDDKVRADLLLEVANAKELFEHRVTYLNENFMSEIANIEAELSAITSKYSELNNDYLAKDAEITATLDKTISDTAELLRTEITLVADDSRKCTLEFQSDLARIEAAVATAREEFSKALTETLDSFNTKYYEISEDYIIRDTTLRVSLVKNIDDATKLLNDRISAVNSFTENVQALLQNEITRIDSKVTAAETDINSTLADINAAFNTKYSEITADYITRDANLKAILSKKLEDAVKVLNTEILDQTNTIQTNLQAETVRLDSAIASVEENLTTSIVSYSESLNNRVTNITEDYISRDANIRAVLTQNLEIASEHLQEDIASVNTRLDETRASIQDELAQLDTKVSTTEKAFESALTNQAEVFNDKIQEITHDYRVRDTNLKATLSKNLTDAVERLEGEIEAVDTRLNEQVIQEINTRLETSIANTTAELTNLVDETKQEVTADFDTKLSDATSGLTGAIESLEKRILGVDSELGDSTRPSLGMIQKQLDSLKAEVSDELNADCEASFANLMYTNITANTSAIEDLTISTNITLMDMETTVEGLSTSLDEANKTITDTFNELTKAIDATKTETKAAVDDVSLQVQKVNESLEITNQKIEVQKGRIDDILALPEGSTQLDGEVIDIRRGFDGTLYGSAGSAVRAIGEQLANYIDNEAINGLYYDLTGEVDEQRPYTLYLTKGNSEIIEESGVQIISGAGGTGSGSNSSLSINFITTSPIKTTTKDEVILRYTFSGTDSSGDKIYQANSEWKVNGTPVEYGTVHDGENEFNVTKYLRQLGSNDAKVFLKVSYDDGNTIATATKTWEIQQKELTISSDFDDKKAYPANEEIIFTYVPTGDLTKTVIFKLDGNEIARKILEAGISGREDKQEIPPQEHGVHLLEVTIEASLGGVPLPPVSLKKNLIWYDPDNNKTPVISVVDSYIEAKQYSTNNIIYTVYDPNATIPTVNIEVDGELAATQKVLPNKDYNDAPTAIFPYVATSVGTHIIKILCDKAEPKEITVEVKKLDITIDPVTTGLVFDFNPAGKTNESDLWSDNGISMSVSKDFDWTNGGYLPDDPDGPCFCIKAGSSATIDYKLFADDAKKLGKEFKLVFKTKNVSNPDAVFLSCLDNTTDKDYIGLRMGVHSANIYGQTGNLELVYSEEDVIEFEFNISPYSSSVTAVNMIMGYEDGVPSRPKIYDSSYNFTQNAERAKVITLGSPDCDLYIYRCKAYNTSLSAAEILSNFTADARTPEEMIARHNRNQIYDSKHKLTPEVLAEKCPWLRVYKVSAPYFTNNKSDKVGRTTIQQIYKNGDPVLDNWTCYNAQHSGQGTSSNNYGAAGRNLDFIMNGSSTYFELGDGSKAREITLTRNSVPVAYLNAKVNIASSNNLTNAILANRYNKFNPYTRPFVRPEGYPIENIKDTMEFHNCVIFIQETDPKLSTHREFADTDWHFYAIGNIGDSKKTDKTRATDPDDPYECCVEIMDVKLPLSDFPTDTMINAMGYTEEEKTKEKIYTWAKDENLGILYEREYTLTADTEINLNKTYYIDMPVKVAASREHLVVENLENLYDRLYVLTTDTELVENKVYYLDAVGTLTTKEFLQTITDPSAAGLYEWRREYKKTTDTEIVPDKIYYIEVMEKTNAMGYTIENVRDYLWAKDENLGTLYECIDGEYLLTEDTTVDLSKTYYTKVEEKDADGNITTVVFNDAMGYVIVQTKVYTHAKNENLDKLYEGTYFKTTDTTVDVSGRKTYYVDILENDDFSEDYTYGWRYISNKKDSAIVNYCKQRWIEFYRFVTTSTDAEFKAKLQDYFVVDSALYYYLFTLRYCMVDNRAKNTFWHYSKTGEKYESDITIYNNDGQKIFSAKAGDDIRKWDLCWDYDNDTSLGLNNYGKQVYRYGLEDTDVDATGEEVFREMDSLFFCRIRDLFAVELKTLYQTLESQNAWHAESFLEECDEWQEEFPEELWRLDIDRKYIRTYTSSFINSKGDSQFLVNMCNGKMKYQRRQWERNQAQYMASKYQTDAASGDNYHANFRFGGPTAASSASAVPANYQLTLTPYSYMYLNVQYGSTAPSTVRVTDANINTPITVPFYGNSADIVNVFSASSIRDFGDLSASYPKTVSIGNASRVKKLTLGNSKPGYNNTVFTTLTTDVNPLLEELDVTNISSMTQTLDLSKLVNLKSVKASGTSIPSVLFAQGGKLNYVELPALTSLELIDLAYLSSDNLKMAHYENIVDLVVDKCPLINKIDLLDKCNNLNRVRLTDVDFGTVDYSYFEEKLFKLKGLSATGEETENASISGTCMIENLSGEEYENLTTRYPNLKINFRKLSSQVTFVGTDPLGNEQPLRIESVVSEKPEDSEEVTFGNCANPGFIATKWPQNAAFTYTQVGWSTKKQTSKGLDDRENDYLEYLQDDALLNISCNRILYPVFKAERRSYEVKFINPTARENTSDYLLKTYNIPYGSSVNYYAPYDNLDAYIEAGQPVPMKLDSSDPNLYAFTGWDPESTLILGETTYKAQFAFLDDKWYELTRQELYNPIYDNSAETMTFDAYMNTSNIAVKVPDTVTSDLGVDCKVVGLGFFLSRTYEHTDLEYVRFPSYLAEIFAEGFKNCINLVELNLPDSLQTIGKSAFQGCDKLKTVHIPVNVKTIRDAAFADCSSLVAFSVAEGNNTFIGNEDYLTDLDQGKLIQGITGRIPADYSIKSLGQNCFSSTSITAVNVPEGVTTIGTNAFSRCYSLSEVSLPSTLTTLGSTCFSWCNSLESIILPKQLKELPTYAFYDCALTTVEIPAIVESIKSKAFGNMSSLEEVVFRVKLADTGKPIIKLDDNGKLNIKIHEQAFLDSGTTTKPIKFYVPWTKDQHIEAFAKDKNGNELDPFFGAEGGSYDNFIFEYICEEAD